VSCTVSLRDRENPALSCPNRSLCSVTTCPLAAADWVPVTFPPKAAPKHLCGCGQEMVLISGAEPFSSTQYSPDYWLCPKCGARETKY
jgi:hypothetical protein